MTQQIKNLINRSINRPGAFLLFTLLGMFLIIRDSHIFYSVTDDLIFYMRFLEGHFVWHGLPSSVSGRFFPLGGISINFAFLFSTSPYAFNAINAILFGTIAFCFYKIALKSGASHALIFATFSLAVLSLGMSNIYTMICYPEAPQMAFLALFFYFGVKFLESKSAKKSLIFAFFSLLFANLALYLKEVTFIFVGGFGFFHLLITAYNAKTFRNLPRSVLIFDTLLMLSAVVFLVAYVFFTFGGERNYVESAAYMVSPTKTMLILLLGVPSVLALFFVLFFRIYRIFWRGDAAHAFFDTLGLCAGFYVLGYIALGMSGLYYYTPAVLFGALYFAFFFKHYALKNAAAKALASVFVILFFTSSLPLSIHQYTRNKTQNANAEAGMAFVAEYIKTHGHTELFFENFARGLNPVWESYAYASWFDSLRVVFGADDFDVKSNRELVGNFRLNPKSRYSFYNKKEADALGVLADSSVLESSADAPKTRAAKNGGGGGNCSYLVFLAISPQARSV